MMMYADAATMAMESTTATPVMGIGYPDTF
jgi:hypothetical protein